jgi:hypothetical protein
MAPTKAELDHYILHLEASRLQGPNPNKARDTDTILAILRKTPVDAKRMTTIATEIADSLRSSRDTQIISEMLDILVLEGEVSPISLARIPSGRFRDPEDRVVPSWQIDPE